MIAFGLVVAVFSLGLLGVQLAGTELMPWYVPVSGFAMAALLYLSRPISLFLRVFVVMYGLGYLFLAGMSAAGSAGLLAKGVQDLLPPPFMATAAVVFALIVYGVSFIPVIRTVMSLADPYFHSPAPGETAYGWFGRMIGSEGRTARVMVGVIIAGNFVQVGLQIRLNLWYRDLFDALQNKNEASFWFQIWWVFVPLLVIWIIFQMIDLIVDSVFDIRWREWLTRSYFARWLGGGTHYGMQTLPMTTDNPDQRIAADVRQFISQTMALSVRLLSQLATLVSFTVILWGISKDFTLPGTSMVIPGFLVWVALAYSVVGTVFTHLIGRPLIRLDFIQEQVEASFRFGLARIREYGEQIALLRGAAGEIQRLRHQFDAIVVNYFELLKRRLKLIGFTFSWQQISVAFPYILIGPYFFAGKVTLGQMQQGASGFGRVEGALSFFISAYQTLAAYKAVLDRLTTFNDAMSRAENLVGRDRSIGLPTIPGGNIAVTDLKLNLPDGQTIVTIPALTLKPGERSLFVGPSGSGKSTLFRALAGIWPYGDGSIGVPEGKSVMLLPQRPYIPMGTLRDAVTYPSLSATYDDKQIAAALDKALLGHLTQRIDEESNWSQILSLGEQQRLAIARALLAKPDWLFLDEATASLDEPTEEKIYAMLVQALPDTTIVSIGHRSTLKALHDRVITMEPTGQDRLFAPAG
jgi:putative ATP-binding cassette transporter